MHKIPIGQLDVSNIAIFIMHARAASKIGLDSKVQKFLDKIRDEIDRAEFEYVKERGKI